MKPVKAWACVQRRTREIKAVFVQETERNIRYQWLNKDEVLKRVEIRELKKRKGKGKA